MNQSNNKKTNRKTQKAQELDDFYGPKSSGNRERVVSSPTSLSSLYGHFGKVAGLFEIYGESIDDWDKKHAKDLEREDWIVKLESTIETLRHQPLKRIQELEDENARLREADQEIAQLRQDLEKQQADLRKKLTEQEQRLEDRERAMEQDLAQKHGQKTAELQKKGNKLQKERDRLRVQLESTKSDLEGKQTQWDREKSMHHDRMTDLEQNLQQVDFAMENKPTQY